MMLHLAESQIFQSEFDNANEMKIIGKPTIREEFSAESNLEVKILAHIQNAPNSY